MACGSWPDWCFAPLRTATPIITERGTTFDHPLLCMKLTGLAAWRMSQGIYRVDPTLYKALAETALDGDIPVDVLLRMPEWAVYIELQGDMATLRGPAQGVWVWMEPGSAPGAVLVCMMFDTGQAIENILNDGSMFPLCFQLSGSSLAASLDATFPKAEGENVHGWFRAAAEPVLSILLYLCSANADVSKRAVTAYPVRPQVVHTRRRGARMYPAAGATPWDVGVRLGAALRIAYASAAAQRNDDAPGRSVMPHLRRAHFHTVVSGPMKNVALASRKRSLRWMPPIAVNLPDVDQLLATIKPVR